MRAAVTLKGVDCVVVFRDDNIVLSFLSLGKKFSGRPMCTLLTTKRYELLYNCGIQLLHVGRPLAAFECLIEAVQVYHANPRLWLRLAECCIAANKGVSAAPAGPSPALVPQKAERHAIVSYPRRVCNT